MYQIMIDGKLLKPKLTSEDAMYWHYRIVLLNLHGTIEIVRVKNETK